MEKFIIFTYMLATTACLIMTIERNVRRKNPGLSRLRAWFIPAPSFFMLGSMICVALESQTNSKTYLSGVADFLLLFGLMSTVVLPLAVAVPWRSVEIHLLGCWGRYFLWMLFAYYPYMIYCGVPSH